MKSGIEMEFSGIQYYNIDQLPFQQHVLCIESSLSQIHTQLTTDQIEMQHTPA